MKPISTEKRGIASVLERMADRILHICTWVEHISGKHPEILAIVIYAVAHLSMAVFHEPWYDEAVSWQIARCASIREILFDIPHYEGHPPLWHLILLPFAKLGAPYELSLTLVSLAFAGTAVALIIWKSPFPRIVRLLLPFTYFFFYQYGVISRPYCVMMLAFMFLAMCYHGRNEKPGRYVLSLMLLCLTSAYGIVIAGGLAMVWVWEIWNKQNVVTFVKTFAKDSRIWWLASLLVLALLLIAEFMPREDAYANYLLRKNSFFLCLLYMMFGSATDVFFTNIYSTYVVLRQIPLDITTVIAMCILGSILWVALFLWGRRKGTVLLVLIPYGIYAVFAALVYLSVHHIGIGLLLLVFWFWVSCEADDREISIGLKPQDKMLAQNAAVVLVALSVAISLFWNMSSCVRDIVSVYAMGREEAAFMTKYDLDQYDVMVEWDVYRDEDGNAVGMDTNHCWYADNISPYFDRNIFFNYNNGDDRQCYSTHRRASAEENAEALAKWSKRIPDVLFMNPELEMVYGDAVTYEEYTLVYSKVYTQIWKSGSNYGYSDIYVRNELVEELGVVEVEPAYPRILDLLLDLNMMDYEVYEDWIER